MRYAFAVAALALVGCGEETPERRSLSGEVTLGGRPVTDGLVTLHGPDGTTATGAIRPDGSYSIDDPPEGLCRVSVADVPRGSAEPSAHGEGTTGVRAPVIPKKYADPDNGLTVDIGPGAEEFAIPLRS